MKVLVVGGGGREHALVWKIAQSPKVDRIFATPGNPGIAQHAECLDLDVEDIEGLCNFAKQENVGLTVVGPEAPLVKGIVDLFQDNGLRIFGPSQKAAQLEGSKVFSKRLMRKHAIPTAEFEVADTLEKAEAFIENSEFPVVVKADGLAAGKGVIVCKTRDEALSAVEAIMREKAFGAAGDTVVIEECLVGQEASILMFVDGNTIAPLPAAQDHKPIGEGDTGPNTGGMGAYCPAPCVSRRLGAQVEREVLIPIIHAMNQDERPYSGILYAGLMLTSEGAKVLEFNCRFGDPEAQPLLLRLKTDLVDILEAVVDRRLDQIEPIEWDSRPAVCVVMASGGYPGNYTKGFPISGIEDAESDDDVVVFQAGTARRGSSIVTSGGRVLGVTALGKNLQEAIDRCYEAVGKIHFEDACYRRDIAAKAVSR